jgi:hypothetical protein
LPQLEYKIFEDSDCVVYFSIIYRIEKIGLSIE